jgi:hypothetical protein
MAVQERFKGWLTVFYQVLERHEGFDWKVPLIA